MAVKKVRLSESIDPMDLIGTDMTAEEFTRGLVERFQNLYPNAENVVIQSEPNDFFDTSITYSVKGTVSLIEPDGVKELPPADETQTGELPNL